MYQARHSSDILEQLQQLDPAEQDDYLTRLVPAITKDPFSNSSLYGRGNMAFRIATFGNARNVLIRIDHAEQRVWFVRFL